MTSLSPTSVLRDGLRFMIPVSVALTVYLYLFPIFGTCSFPLPLYNGSDYDSGMPAFTETARLHWPSLVGSLGAGPPRKLAAFRLFALADPQLEGDTSIPDAHGQAFRHLVSLFRHLTFQSWHANLWQRIRWCWHDAIDIWFEDVPNTLESVRKRVDLLGNDYYLAHLYRTVHWWTRPTHVSVLGDLVGSQWLEDDEFEQRSWRYWNRVFRGGERMPDEFARAPVHHHGPSGFLGGPDTNETLAWARRIINVAGNHDIGYAGDISSERMERFERAFGKANYELRFALPLSNVSLDDTIYDAMTNPTSVRLRPELRIVVLNDMNLDTPVASVELQDATYTFINAIINTASAVELDGHFTLVLTHIPLHKPPGVCVDEPLFDFHHHDGSLKEQNQLSEPASKGFLEGILGMSGDSEAAARGRGRPGAILNGHDHEGCDTWHFINQSHPADERVWDVYPWPHAQAAGLVGRQTLPGVREITVRSMMGDFGGNAGLLSVWFDEDTWAWRLAYATCPLGTQHLWWLTHILDLCTVVALLMAAVCAVLAARGVHVDAWLLSKTDKAFSWSRAHVRHRRRLMTAAFKAAVDAVAAVNAENANGSSARTDTVEAGGEKTVVHGETNGTATATRTGSENGDGIGNANKSGKKQSAEETVVD